LPLSYDEFIALESRKSGATASHAMSARLAFDPDAMAAWCRRYFGTTDATARQFYATFLVRSPHAGPDGR
jgi:hypothetical protein